MSKTISTKKFGESDSNEHLLARVAYRCRVKPSLQVCIQ